MATGEKQSDFKRAPTDQAQRWAKEIAAAKANLKDWYEQGDRAVKRYLDERDSKSQSDRRLNLYSANVQTKMASLYGNTPKVSVSRRFGDASDDVARVAGEMMERILNADIERDGDTYAEALQYALSDILIPGFGLCRVRYVAGFEPVAEVPAILDEATGEEIAPLVPATERKVYECAETDYVHWRGVLWSPARVPHEIRWIGFENLLSREGLIKRFGNDVGSKIPLEHNKPDKNSKLKEDPWGRAVVWEIHDKESKEVIQYVEGYPEVLETKPDPLKLEGFWPCPRPVITVSTTSGVVPKPDFELARDQYNAVDELQRRIDLLLEAVRVAGVYDKTAGEVGKLLKEAGFSDLVPASNWAALQEKGGVRGAIDWFPIEPITNAIVSLTVAQDRAIEQVYQVTGMADIMRGTSDPSETARAQGIKAKFGSIRLQRLQDEFARFASDIQRLKGEIIAKHFDPETIIKASNIMHTPDAHLAQEAVQLIKSDFSQYRIEVKPEAISLTDFAAQKQERTEVIAAVSQFLTAAMPLGQAVPGAAPGLLEILQWMVAGVKGSSQIEGVLDRMIEQAKQAAAQPQQQAPDPKLIAQQMKGEQDMQKVQAELQADLVRTQAEVQANAAQEQNQMQWNVKEHLAKTQISNALKPPAPVNGGSKR